MSKASAKLRTAFAALDAIYAQLPTIACQGHCARYCTAIVLTDLEARRLQLATHAKPRTVNGRCVYLTEHGRCSVHAARPLICRAWGLVRLLSCPHGCLPDRWLTDPEFLQHAQAVERIGGGRLLQTAPEGLCLREGDTYAQMGAPTRDAADIEAHAERVRNLRALHGGRIMLALTEEEKAGVAVSPLATAPLRPSQPVVAARSAPPPPARTDR
jgi:hypothetical protein